jgi:diguanylate cyclase (GGDEF)-like protein
MRIRAPQRLVALLALTCVLGACRRSQERAVSLSEIARGDAALAGHRVRTTAIVTYSDPEWHVLIVQDQGTGFYLGLPAKAHVEAGDLVEITGKVLPSHDLDKPVISVLSSNNPLPSPVLVRDPSGLVPLQSQFVEIRGSVQWSGMKNGLPALQIWSKGKPVLVYVRQALVQDLPAYGSEVRVSGVSALDVDSSDRLLNTVHIFTASSRQVKVVTAGAPDPFTLRLRRVAELQKITPGVVVHVRGLLARTNGELAVSDAKISVPLELSQAVQDTAGSWEVAGFWNGNSLEYAVARRLSTQSARTGDIVRLSDLKRLSIADAAARKTVNVRAVITYFDPNWGVMFVQDRTGGSYVDTHNQILQLQPGDLVDVSGVSDPGQFAPMIAQPSIGFVKRTPLPSPLMLELMQGNWNLAESLWCSYRGVVHSAKEQDGHTILRIGAGRTEMAIQIPMLIHAADLVDQEFTATGVLGMVFNDRRQAIGHRLFVPSREFLLPIAAEHEQTPVATIDSLQRYRPDVDERHAVRLKGVVVLKSAPDRIFIQDESAGIQVRGAGPLKVSNGDLVSAHGFVVPGEYSPVLEDAAVDLQAHGVLAIPKPITPKEAADGHYDSQYVSMRAVVSAVRPSTDGTIVLLNDQGTFFQAFGPSSANLNSLQIGSLIEIRGVCRVSFDEARQAVNGFTLTFDSWQSLNVLRTPPWWNTHNITWALFLIVAVALMASLWVLLLRRKVDQRTSELKKSIDARRKAQKFDVARNQVLEAIARNAPPPESMELLALSVQEQVEGSICVIAMPQEGKAILSGSPAAALIAPSLSEEIQLQMLPPVTAMFSDNTGEERKDRPDLMRSLLEIFDRSRSAIKDGELVIAFSGAGTLAGLLMVFWGETAPTDAETVSRVLQSASRLVSLAGDHWHMHERLLFEARHDILTGLPNRNVAEDRLEQAVARAQRHKQLFAVLCIDLDGFKEVNDTLGHEAGDNLLRIVGNRLRSRIRQSDTLARVGGDEFFAIVEECANDTAAVSVCESLISALQQPIMIDGTAVSISGSIGVAMYPTDGKHNTELRRHADQAMYRAKSQGRGRMCFWAGEPPSDEKTLKTTSASG